MTLPAVRYALTGDSATADSGFGVLRSRDGGAPFQVGCVAILLDGYPIGVLILGERLDRVLPRFATSPVTEAVVTIGDSVVVPRGGSTAAVTPTSSPRACPWATPTTASPATLDLARSVAGSLRPLTTALGRSFVLAGLLAVLLVTAGAVLVSRTTLRPLARFVSFLRAGASGRDSEGLYRPLRGSRRRARPRSAR